MITIGCDSGCLFSGLIVCTRLGITRRESLIWNRMCLLRWVGFLIWRKQVFPPRWAQNSSSGVRKNELCLEGAGNFSAPHIFFISTIQVKGDKISTANIAFDFGYHETMQFPEGQTWQQMYWDSASLYRVLLERYKNSTNKFKKLIKSQVWEQNTR